MENTIIDCLYRISLKDFRLMGLLNRERSKRTIRISRINRLGKVHDSFLFAVTVVLNNREDLDYIQLNYNLNGHDVEQVIPLIRIKSNLKGRGSNSYYYRLICPLTQKQGMKLYLCGNGFCHRAAIDRGAYSIQLLNRSQYRADGKLNILGQRIHQFNKAGKAMRQRYFKHTYAGVPTKKMQMYMKISDSIEDMD